MDKQQFILILALICVIVICAILLSQLKKQQMRRSQKMFETFGAESRIDVEIKKFKSQLEIEFNDSLEREKDTLKNFYINDAIIRSLSVTKGKVTEHLAPFLIDAIFDPAELVFVGSPIDMISFSNIQNSSKVCIDLLEIKTGKSSLNKKQQLIREAISNKRIYYRNMGLNN